MLDTASGMPVGTASPFPGRVSDGCFIAGRRQIVLAGSATADETGEFAFKIHNQDLSKPGLIVASSS